MLRFYKCSYRKLINDEVGCKVELLFPALLEDFSLLKIAVDCLIHEPTLSNQL